MVMDLVTGGELFETVAKHGRLAEDTARTYFQQLVDGIEYCHSRRVYHRDLKPENLLVSEDRRTLKITDFGLASIKEQNASTELLWTVMGSPHYIPPEIITSAAKGYEGEKVDVWASGMILYGMLGGCLPFDFPDTNQLYRAIVQSPVQYPPHFSPQVIQMLDAIFEKAPAKRPNMTQVKAFDWFQVNYNPVVPRSPRHPEEKKKRKSKKKKMPVAEHKNHNCLDTIDTASIETSSLQKGASRAHSTVNANATAEPYSHLTISRQNTREESPKKFKSKSKRSALGLRAQQVANEVSAKEVVALEEEKRTNSFAKRAASFSKRANSFSKGRQSSKSSTRAEVRRFPSNPQLSTAQTLASTASEDLTESALEREPSLQVRRSLLSARKSRRGSTVETRKDKGGAHAYALSNVLASLRKKGSYISQPSSPAPAPGWWSNPGSPEAVKKNSNVFDIEHNGSDVSPYREEEPALFWKNSDESTTSSRSLNLLGKAYRKGVEGMKARGMTVKSLSLRSPKGVVLETAEEYAETNCESESTKRASGASALIHSTELPFSQPVSPISPTPADTAISGDATVISNQHQAVSKSLPPASLRNGDDSTVGKTLSSDDADCDDTPRALRNIAIAIPPPENDNKDFAPSAMSAATADDMEAHVNIAPQKPQNESHTAEHQHRQRDEALSSTTKAARSPSPVRRRSKEANCTSNASPGIFKPTKLLFAADNEHCAGQAAEAPDVLCPSRFNDDNEYPEWCLDSNDVFADAEEEDRKCRATGAGSSSAAAPQVAKNGAEDGRSDSEQSKQRKSIFAPLNSKLARNLSKTANEISLDKSKDASASSVIAKP